MREGINWLVFGFCKEETVMDLVESTGVETLIDGRLLRAAGLMSKSAMVVGGPVVGGAAADAVADVVRKRAVLVACGGSAQRRANSHSWGTWADSPGLCDHEFDFKMMGLTC